MYLGFHQGIADSDYLSVGVKTADIQELALELRIWFRESTINGKYMFASLDTTLCLRMKENQESGKMRIPISFAFCNRARVFLFERRAC